MTLQDAIEEVKAKSSWMFGAEYDAGDVLNGPLSASLEAIATILNAVVKGELRTQPEPRKALLNRYAMRNGHTKEQRPDESREDYNLRVYGLREEDIE